MVGLYRHSAWMIGLIAAASVSAADVAHWHAEGLAIAQPLDGLRGDVARGRALVIARDKGNCLACHQLPIPEEPSHGTVGPPLMGVGARLNEGELRLRVVDEKQVNPDSIMPSFHLDPAHLYRPRPDMASTILTAQEIEDIVAYLVTLR